MYVFLRACTQARAFACCAQALALGALDASREHLLGGLRGAQVRAC